MKLRRFFKSLLNRTVPAAAPQPVTIHAMDSASFAAFAKANHQAIADAVALNLQSSHGRLTQEIRFAAERQ